MQHEGVTKRRAWGSGSIVQRRPGVWRVVVSAGTDPWTGRRRQVVRTVAGTKRDAQAVLEQLRADFPRDPESSATVAQLVAEWWPVANLRPQTRALYRRSLDRVILPTLGKRRLRDLRPPDVEAWHQHLMSQGASVDVCRTAHTVLSAALTHAGRLGWVSRNVARLARKPTAERPERSTPTPAQLRALLHAAALEGPIVEAWMRLAIVTGGRRSEVLALRWPDIDLRAGTVTIRRSLVRDGGKVTEGPTKTGKARTVSIGSDTVAMLTALAGWLERRADETNVAFLADGYVLPADLVGAVPIKPSLATAMWRRLADAAGVPVDVRLHDVRHAMVSRVVAEVGVAAASKRAGHASSKMTLDVYAHSVDDQDKQAAEAVERQIQEM